MSMMWYSEDNTSLYINFRIFTVPPMIWIQNQLVGAAIGQSITLECQSEAFPKSINYWMKNDSIIIPSKYTHI